MEFISKNKMYGYMFEIEVIIDDELFTIYTSTFYTDFEITDKEMIQSHFIRIVELIKEDLNVKCEESIEFKLNCLILYKYNGNIDVKDIYFKELIESED